MDFIDNYNLIQEIRKVMMAGKYNTPLKREKSLYIYIYIYKSW